jgi:hypothetical protein
MSAVLIEVDSTCPEPPFTIEKVFIVKGSTQLPNDITDRSRMIICLVGTAAVTVRTGEIETFELTKPTTALLLDAGNKIESFGGPENQLSVIY